MKKLLLILVLSTIIGGVVHAQAQQTKPRTQNTPIFIEDKEIVIDAKSKIPATGIYKAKADTSVPNTKYRFILTDKVIKEQSENLLNKWLKESK